MSPLLLLLGPALAQEAPVPEAAPAAPEAEGAIVVGLQGAAWVTHQGGPPVGLDRCAVVPVGATVCTDAGAYATVRLASTPDAPGAEDVVLLPGTCLAIEEATLARAQVAVSSGSIAVASKEAPLGVLAVRTRDGVAEGAEGGFRVTLEDAATRTEAVAGAVTLTGDGGSVAMPAGTGSRVSAGKAPTDPIDLLLTEALLTPFEGASLRRPDFSWQEVPNSTGYHVELSANPAFTDIIESIDVADPAWSPDFLFIPTAIEGLWWRVSAYDRLGFLGVPSEARPLLLPAGVSG